MKSLGRLTASPAHFARHSPEVHMMTPRPNPRRGAFTLVEILIVVVILGILASIVIPHFANASDQAKRSSLVSTLQSVRSQVELFMLQHGDKAPALTGSDWSDLTDQTTYSGKTVGPYLTFAPVNPVNGHSDILVVSTDQAGGDDVAGTKIGFVYNSSNGKLWATNHAADKIYNETNPDDPGN
jgi:prepilin-type N-terminal cleavage/methylation domain-containing protein